MDQTREKLHCSVCGWEWWKRLGAPDPKRCAKATCRSMCWKTGLRPSQKPPVAFVTPPEDPDEDPCIAEIVDEDPFGVGPLPERTYEPIEE